MPNYFTHRYEFAAVLLDNDTGEVHGLLYSDDLSAILGMGQVGRIHFCCKYYRHRTELTTEDLLALVNERYPGADGQGLREGLDLLDAAARSWDGDVEDIVSYMKRDK